MDPLKSNEFKRWLAEQGGYVRTWKGSHLKVMLGDRRSVLPMHHKELGTGLVAAIKKQLGLKQGDAMQYPIKIKADGKFFLVSFPDIPEAITQGESIEEAMLAAADALDTALEFYFDEHRVVPAPSRVKRGQRFVELPVSVSAKVLLLNEMIQQKVRPAELARRMRTTPQEVNRLTSIHHVSKIDGVAAAMKTLGKTFEIRAV